MKKVEKARRAMTIAVMFTVASSIVSSLILRVNMLNLVVGIFLGMFTYAVFGTVIMSAYGWRTFNRKMIFRMPRSLFVSYVIFSVLLVLIFVGNLQLELLPDVLLKSKKILNLTISVFAGSIGSLCLWYAGVGERIALVNKSEIISVFQTGYSEEKIEEEIINIQNSVNRRVWLVLNTIHTSYSEVY